MNNGLCVDMGAQWMGPGQRRVHALVNEFGVATIATHAVGDTVVEVNGRLKRMAGSNLPLSWWAKLDALRFGWGLDREARKVPVHEPWNHARAGQLDSVSFNAWLEARTFSGEARRYWRYLVESGLCTSADDISPLEVLQQLASIGGLRSLETAEQEFIEGGAQIIAERLAGELGDRVHLDAPVLAIQQHGSSVRVVTEGGEYRGRRVIIAIPPQLIGTISFDPIMRGSACDPVLGRVIKTVVVYECAWWRKAGLSGIVAALDGPVTLLLDSSGPAGQPGVLVALATGRDAAKLALMDETARHAAVIATIKRLLGAEGSQAMACFSTDWMDQPWSRGGYASRRKIGGWTDRENATFLPQGLLHFAGTETASEWRSYMEGALQSAERATREVINAIHG